jgi:hypothetical protein
MSALLEPNAVNVMRSENKPVNYSQIILSGFAAIIIVLAAASFVTDMNLADILKWIEAYFGLSFTLFYLALMGVGLTAFVKIQQGIKPAFWFEVGQQAGNGISTLALTYTLLGISLGIGALSGQALTPESVQTLIGELTAQFSLAFMTTVVGLPSATLVRGLISIKYAAYIENHSSDALEASIGESQ